MSRVATIAVASAVLAACASPPAVPPGTTTAGTRATPDGASLPAACRGFDALVNDAWRASHPIPEGQPKWGRRIASREANRAAVQELLGALAARPGRSPGSKEQILGDHFASCIDEATIDARGLEPLAPWLAELDAMRTPADVQRALRRLHAAGISALFGTQGAYDYREPSRFEVHVVGAPSDEAARKALDGADPAAWDRYRTEVGGALARSGLDPRRTPDAARDAVAIERRLAEASMPASRAADPAGTAHRVSFVELERMAPHVDWRAYFDDAGWARDDVNVTDPGRLRQVDHELASVPPSTWRVYLRWQLLLAAGSALPASVAPAPGDAVARGERARACVEATEEAFPELLGRAYVEQRFPPAAKEKMRALVAALVDALHEEVDTLTWMTPATRRRAHEQIRALDAQVGYPDVWQSAPGPVVSRGTYWENLVAARRFAVRANRALVGKPTDRGSWLVAPSAPTAYIDPQLHEIVLPAGFLQAPAFSVDADDADNLGAIGAGVAHDLLHGIDLLGADYEPDGAPRNWWTDADRRGLEERGTCVRDQLEAFPLAPGLALHGRQTFGEAAADLGGVRVALRALERSMEAHPLPTTDGLTPVQRFFVAVAKFREEDARPEAVRAMVAADIHPVAAFRIDGTLANVPELARAFSCPDASPMVRPEALRCAVW